MKKLGLLLLASIAINAQMPEGTGLDKGVADVIFRNCQGCHTNGGHAGGLVMNTQALLLKGGSRGAVVVPGDPAKSRLLMAIDYQDSALQMPPRGRIPQGDIDLVRRWISGLGAADASPMVTAKPAKAPVPVPVGRPMLEAPVSASPVAVAAAPAVAAKTDGAVTPEQEKFFETNIRPVLVSKCYTCHTQAANGGLRLDSREALLKGGSHGPVVMPGKPDESKLLAAVRQDGGLKMPPGGPLEPSQINALREWIADGAPWPSPRVATAKLPASARQFWSFQKPVQPAVPQTTSQWPRNDIDRFVFAKLEEKKLKPVADASKRTLLRRATYDLTGLPPTPSEAEAFMADPSPAAYDKLIERLLASRAYGERWGRKWLDLVRYADTAGGDGDFPIPQAIQYRDYAIKAFTEDKPFDRFIHEQLAGDLLPAASADERWNNVVATGYLAGAQRMEEKNGHYADAVDNLGYTFLGMSVACARCHDHKFDPLPTADYYALYGIIRSTTFANPGYGAVRWQTGFTYRDPKALQREDWKVFQAQLEPISNALLAVLKLPGTYDDLVPQLQMRRMNLFKLAPDLGEAAYAVTEGVPHNERIAIYGDEKNLGAEAQRGFLRVIDENAALSPETKGSGRLELAKWLTHPDHPLTARVMVNRIWQGHFGRGLVASPNDFGRRGVAPSNQALLDWLALKFVESGWSVKAIHREILQSRAYRLSGARDAANEEIDPANDFVWRHSHHQLEAEEVRDSMLAAAGLLDRTVGGQHPFPPMSQWNYEQQNLFEADAKAYETDRRTVYQMVQRTVRPDLFVIFDGPATNASTEQRTRSLTPLQSLFFLNGELPIRAAASLSASLVKEGGSSREWAGKAMAAVYGRPATAEEMERSAGFLSAMTDRLGSQGNDPPAARRSALEQFIKALFASNEFMFVD